MIYKIKLIKNNINTHWLFTMSVQLFRQGPGFCFTSNKTRWLNFTHKPTNKMAFIDAIHMIHSDLRAEMYTFFLYVCEMPKRQSSDLWWQREVVSLPPGHEHPVDSWPGTRMCRCKWTWPLEWWLMHPDPWCHRPKRYAFWICPRGVDRVAAGSGTPTVWGKMRKIGGCCDKDIKRQLQVPGKEIVF